MYHTTSVLHLFFAVLLFSTANLPGVRGTCSTPCNGSADTSCPGSTCYPGVCALSGTDYCCTRRNANDGTLCPTTDIVPSNPCALTGSCSSGVCQPGTTQTCTSSNPCRNGQCVLQQLGNVSQGTPNTVTCSYASTLNAACNDNSACTTVDTCDGNGNCVGSTSPCPAPNACVYSYACNPTQNGFYCSPTNNPANTTCNDGNSCTSNDMCNYLNPGDSAMSCFGSFACDDSNPTTTDTCTLSGCSHKSLYTELRGFGVSPRGAMGVNTPDGSAAAPTLVAGLPPLNITQVSTFSLHSMVLMSDGSLYGAGNNDWGELGPGPVGANNGAPAGYAIYTNASSSFTPVSLSGVPTPWTTTQIAVGGNFTMISNGTGSLGCGMNAKSQLSVSGVYSTNAWIPSVISKTSYNVAPGLQQSVFLQTTYPPIGVAAGANHTIIYSQLTLWAFGACGSYQCGKQLSQQFVTSPTAIVGVSGINSTVLFLPNIWVLGGQPLTFLTPLLGSMSDKWAYVSAGSKGNLALTQGSVVYCWGSNSDGELGMASTFPVPIPTQLTFFAKGTVTAVSMGSSFSVFIASNGVWLSGRLGSFSSTIPVQLTTPSNIKGISAGNTHLLLWSQQMVYIYGNCANTSYPSVTPVPYYAGLSGMTVVTAAAGYDYNLIAATYDS